MKLKSIQSIVLVLGLIVLAGCGEQSNNNENIDSGGERNTITFFHYKETVVDGIDHLNQAFMDENPEVTVEQEMVATEYNTVLTSKINVDRLPEIFVTGTTSKRSIQKYIDEGLIAELSGLDIVKSLPKDIVDSVTNEDGSIYVLPFLNTARGIIYNEVIFEEAGIEKVPETLSELEEACIKIEAIGVTPFAVAGAEGWSLGSIPWQVSQEAYSDREWIEKRWNGEATFADNALPAFDFMDLMLNHCNENPMDMDYMSQVTGFVVGEYAMMAQGPWAFDTALELDPEADKWGRMMPIPVSENKEDSKLYIDNDIYLLVSSQADLELIDDYFMYILGGSGKDIFAQEIKVLNAFGIDFETHQVNKDILSYIHNNDIIGNYQYNNMPDGFWQSNAKVMQEYVMGNLSKEEALSMLDDEWDSMTRE